MIALFSYRDEDLEHRGEIRHDQNHVFARMYRRGIPRFGGAGCHHRIEPRFPGYPRSLGESVAQSAVEGDSGWDIAWRSPGFVGPIWRLNGGCTVRLVLGGRTSTLARHSFPVGRSGCFRIEIRHGGKGAEASTDMTPCIIAAIGLNQRAPDSRRLPNDRLLAPDCASAGSGTHRVAHPKPLIRVVIWSRFRSMPNSAILFRAWEASAGKSRFGRSQNVRVLVREHASWVK